MICGAEVLKVHNRSVHVDFTTLDAFPESLVPLITVVQSVFCRPDQLAWFDDWPRDKVTIVAKYTDKLPNMEGLGLAIPYATAFDRELQFKDAFSDGKIKRFSLYGLGYLPELKSYAIENSAFLRCFEWVITGVPYIYATYNSRLSCECGAFKHLPIHDDCKEFEKTYIAIDLGYEREETYILNSQILDTYLLGAYYEKSAL